MEDVSEYTDSVWDNFNQQHQQQQQHRHQHQQQQPQQQQQLHQHPHLPDNATSSLSSQHRPQPASHSASSSAFPGSDYNLKPLTPMPDDVLKIYVSDPQKHGEGNNAFVTYLVTTKTILDTFRVPEVSVRRRFQDFDWLHKSLTDEIPATILPPLPDRHRMEYITGDRFSNEFIERRRYSLEIYLSRLSRHPTIQRTASLKKFLEVSDLRTDREEKKRDAGVFENLSDTLMNAFTKIREPDERFVEAKDGADKLEANLQAIERLHARLLKQHTELGMELAELSECINILGQMETQITEPLRDFSSVIQQMTNIMKEKSANQDIPFISNVRDYISYCESVKDILRLRDQKQVDYEELSQLLFVTRTEREKTSNPARFNRGIASFIKDKYQEIQGIDSEIARKSKLNRLDRKIAELQIAVEQSQEISAAFSNEVARELAFFQVTKVEDFKEILGGLLESEIDYHRKGFQYWDNLLPVIEGLNTSQ